MNGMYWNEYKINMNELEIIKIYQKIQEKRIMTKTTTTNTIIIIRKKKLFIEVKDIKMIMVENE